MSRRLILLLAGLALVLTACGRSLSAPPATGGYRLILDEGFGSPSERIAIRDSGSGAIERQLPIGTPAPDWSRYYVATPGKLAAIDPLTGRTLAQLAIPSGYVLPQLSFGGPTGGLSPNGQWLALTGHGQTSSGQPVTSFLVGPTSLAQPFTEIHLIGQYEFDALTDDGQSLYLIEALPEQGHYHVRLFDVPSHILRPQVVVDKSESTESMAGIRGDSLAQPAGDYVFTIYARTDNVPFIHALPLGMPFAYCIDLPSNGINDVEQQFHWSLAATPDGDRLYAVNGPLGSVALITSVNGFPKIERSAQLALKSRTDLFAGLVVNAEAKGAPIGGAALTNDGRTLYAVADLGLLAIDTSTLNVRSHLLDGERLGSIRISVDAKWLYAADTATSKVYQIDPNTGAIAGQIPGTISDIWGILWASPQ